MDYFFFSFQPLHLCLLWRLASFTSAFLGKVRVFHVVSASNIPDQLCHYEDISSLAFLGNRYLVVHLVAISLLELFEKSAIMTKFPLRVSTLWIGINKESHQNVYLVLVLQESHAANFQHLHTAACRMVALPSQYWVLLPMGDSELQVRDWFDNPWQFLVARMEGGGSGRKARKHA